MTLGRIARDDDMDGGGNERLEAVRSSLNGGDPRRKSQGSLIRRGGLLVEDTAESIHHGRRVCHHDFHCSPTALRDDDDDDEGMKNMKNTARPPDASQPTGAKSITNERTNER